MTSLIPIGVPFILFALVFGPPSRAEGWSVSMPLSFPSLSADPVENLGASLRFAAREGRIKEVARLLEKGADVNATGEFGETALMYAARFGFTQVVELLLEHGAEVNARDSSDNTALLNAARNCSMRAFGLILGRGADVNWVNSEGRTALILAAEAGCLPIVNELLKIPGVRLHHKDNSGSTALDCALAEAQLEVGGRFTDIATALREAGGEAIPRPRP